jgi:predicted nucleic acid-binding protein
VSSRAQFQEDIEDARRLHLDPVVIGYHLIGRPPFVELTRLLFAGLRSEKVRAQTSAISFYQLLTEPYRRGREELAVQAYKYLSGQRGLEIVPLTGAVARQAAEVRARLGGSDERAIQIATALQGGVRAYVTDKTALRRVAGMEVISLGDYVRG